MTYAERAQTWNEWYDGLPDRWRFQVVLWPLLLVGTVNMMLTISSGFPFGLLLILAILFIAFVRVPHKAGWVRADRELPAGRGVHLGRVDWAWRLNQRYDAMPEWRRFWVIPAVLIVAGAVNMALTLAGAFPFALLFLLALLAIIALRAPYVWGWLTPPPNAAAAPPAPMRPAQDTRLAAEPESRAPEIRAPESPAPESVAPAVPPGHDEEPGREPLRP